MEKFNRFLPETPLIENDDFVIYGNSDLEPVVKDILDSLTQYKVTLLKFFNLDSYRKISINLFNNRDTYLEFSRQFYEPASYSQGNIANGMINYSYDINQISRLKTTLMHELAHIFYRSIYNGKYDRIIWFDEGLAQYLSGEKNSLEKDDDKFKEWYLDKIVGCGKEIPKIEFLQKHGGSYGSFVDTETNKYSGYDLSYLMIRYIIEHDDDIISLLHDGKRIKDLETHILKDCIEYYNKHFQVGTFEPTSNNTNKKL